MGKGEKIRAWLSPVYYGGEVQCGLVEKNIKDGMLYLYVEDTASSGYCRYLVMPDKRFKLGKEMYNRLFEVISGWVEQIDDVMTGNCPEHLAFGLVGDDSVKLRTRYCIFNRRKEDWGLVDIVCPKIEPWPDDYVNRTGVWAGFNLPE